MAVPNFDMFDNPTTPMMDMGTVAYSQHVEQNELHVFAFEGIITANGVL